ncbi:MAG: carbohydrate binding family 9 domain-containing protein [Calditrichaeota bacterium]|nr:carbohydrate binding family 9 domain-containing protein [Calditrichota bacterium]
MGGVDYLPKKASRIVAVWGGVGWLLISAGSWAATGRGAARHDDFRRSIEATWAQVRPEIDGCLLDSAWQAVAFQGDFVQREPEEGAASSERTEVAVLYDAENLYLGVKCYDTEPERLVAREMLRDTQLDDDDNFEIVIDSYRDRRSGFYFVVNPRGAMRDAVFSNEGRNFNPAWDGIWKCRTQVNHLGWFAEIAIPWKTLRFARQDTQVWGINFARTIRRKNEYTYWQLVPRDIGWVGLFRLSEAGTLRGLAGLRGGGTWDIKPYVVGGIERDVNTSFATVRRGDLGLDAKMLVTPNIVVDLTVNPDFAQVEADREQVNLTRFSLYFPEKREFFLEGGDVFSFGSGRGPGGGNMELFYSRRIGLAGGSAIPIIGGAKLVGKIGNYQVGALNMVTRAKTLEDGELVPAANFSVLRVRRDLMSRASLGLLFTSKDELSTAAYGRSLGVDGFFPLSDYLTVSGWAAGEFGAGDGRGYKALLRHTASELSVRYHSDLWSFGGGVQDVGAAFDPAMGFVRRRDFRRAQVSGEYSPRPRNATVIRQFSYRLGADWRTDHAGTLLDSGMDASFGVRFQNSAHLQLGVSREYEWLPEAWELRPGLVVPQGEYTGYEGFVEVTSDRGRSLSGSLDLHAGAYYTGRNVGLRAESEFTAIPQVKLALNYNHNYVSLDGGQFHTNTLGVRFFYFFSTELFFKAYVQWNDDRLNYGGKHRIVSNFLLRWIYSPGSDLYVVVNDGRLVGPGGQEITNRTVLLKATRFLRT